MDFAILSDVHANLEALEAVLADVAVAGHSRGLLSGGHRRLRSQSRASASITRESFGPVFWETTTKGPCLIRRASAAERNEPSSGHATSWRSGGTTRRNSFAAGNSCANCRARSSRGTSCSCTGPRAIPLNEYVFPEDIYNPRKLSRVFSLVPGTCFQGHTHVPGVFAEDCRFLYPSEIGNRYRLNQHKAMINVGSVGQPRDGNPLASYVVVHGDLVEFRRVSYPLERTIEKIYAIPELDNFLGDRLREGR